MTTMTVIAMKMGDMKVGKVITIITIMLMVVMHTDGGCQPI